MLIKDDINLFYDGANAYSYRFFGCHLSQDQTSLHFAVWAPHAQCVSLVGEWNDWDESACKMKKIDERGVWAVNTTTPKEGMLYKYAITSRAGELIFKADPFAFEAELRPGTASRIKTKYAHKWNDSKWMASKQNYSPYDQPISIYEMHLGSWTKAETYTEIAVELIPYLKKMNYTHVEFMPVAEYPYDGSWGYQMSGYFAPTSRYGKPEDLMYLIDALHQAGIGILIDWVPAHFPKDAFALANFDGETCYESSDSKMAEHPEWGTLIFDCSKNEVCSFLISSAIFWLDVFHVDGLRVDAVSSMIYLDYGRDNNFTPNIHGGNQNLEAIGFLRKTSEFVFRDFPGTIYAAEESSSFPLVTMPTNLGGLGFNYKWNMGWMHDMLNYMSTPPMYRPEIQNKLTFSMYYAFSENYILPLSHDEVVHGKKSLLDKMPGTIEEKFANLRAFFMFMFIHPGKKLIFMGTEIGEFIEWRYYEPLEWHLLQYENHKKLQHFISELNLFYVNNPALYQIDNSWDGFKWLSIDDTTNCSISLMRISKNEGEEIIAICNFSENELDEYRLGLPFPAKLSQVMFSNDIEYGGDGKFSNSIVYSENYPWNSQDQSIELKLAPLSSYYFRVTRTKENKNILPIETAKSFIGTKLSPSELYLDELQG